MVWSLSAVVVTWNVKAHLQECLESLLGQDRKCDLIVVVDNASTDGTPSMLKERFPFEKFPALQVIENGENVGFARGVNQGIKEILGFTPGPDAAQEPSCPVEPSAGRGLESRYILLLNPDTVLLPGALSSMLHCLDLHPEAGGAGCLILNEDRTFQPISNGRIFPTPLTELFLLTGLSKLFPGSSLFNAYLLGGVSRSSAMEVPALSGCCVLVRKEVVEEVGLLDERFFMYGEDLDWFYRMREKGWKLFWTPEGRIVHKGRQSAGQVSARMFLEAYRSMRLFHLKHYGKQKLFWLTVASLSGHLVRSLLCAVGACLPGRAGKRSGERLKASLLILKEIVCSGGGRDDNL